MSEKPGDDPKNKPNSDDDDKKKKSEPSGDTDPDKKKTGKEGRFDPKDLSDEELAKALEDPRIWKTDRLKQLREDSKELKKRQDADEEAEKKRLEEQGEYKKLLEKNEKELKAARDQAEKAEIRAQFTSAAMSKGISGKKLDAALKLADLSGVTKSDDGYTGINEAVEALTKEHDYLISESSTSVGSGSNPGGGNPSTGQFTITQISDPKFYQEHRDEIMRAQAEGKIVEDRTIPTATSSGASPDAS